jgi:hypothetical protein
MYFMFFSIRVNSLSTHSRSAESEFDIDLSFIETKKVIAGLRLWIQPPRCASEAIKIGLSELPPYCSTPSGAAIVSVTVLEVPQIPQSLVAHLVAGHREIPDIANTLAKTAAMLARLRPDRSSPEGGPTAEDGANIDHAWYCRDAGGFPRAASLFPRRVRLS